MFEISIERTFAAAHALTIRGTRERTHGHNWHVTATFVGETLDADGLLCDFHELERHLDEIIAPFANGDLNATPPFDKISPTAERVAEHIAVALQRKLPAGPRVGAVRVTEAPGCAATYRLR